MLFYRQDQNNASRKHVFHVAQSSDPVPPDQHNAKGALRNQHLIILALSLRRGGDTEGAC